MESSISIAARTAEVTSEREYRFPRAFIQGNTATFATYALGAGTISLFCWPAAVIYAFYCVASTVAMWAAVCVNCPYYGGVCPCGYSTMSTSLFRKGDVRLMPKTYKLIWAYVAPSWLAPIIAAAPILAFQFSWPLFIALTVFVLMAFLITPAISKAAGCCEYWRDALFRRGNEMSAMMQARESRVSEELAWSSTYRGTMMPAHQWATDSVGIRVHSGSVAVESPCHSPQRRPVRA